MPQTFVYEMVLDDPDDNILSSYAPHTRPFVKSLLIDLEKSNINVKDIDNWVLPNEQKVTNGKDLINYYISPDITKRPKNINAIDNILYAKKSYLSKKLDVKTNKKLSTQDNPTTSDIHANKWSKELKGKNSKKTPKSIERDIFYTKTSNNNKDHKFVWINR